MKIYRILPEPEYFRKLIRAKKVAAYCRVSSFNEEQLSSYRNQIEYYEAYIKRVQTGSSVLLQKTYVPDCMTSRQVTNDGQLPQYLIENNHEAIIKK